MGRPRMTRIYRIDPRNLWNPRRNDLWVRKNESYCHRKVETDRSRSPGNDDPSQSRIIRLDRYCGRTARKSFRYSIEGRLARTGRTFGQRSFDESRYRGISDRLGVMEIL